MSSRTALIRIHSFGSDIKTFYAWLKKSIKGMVNSGMLTIYIDLPLSSQLTILIGQNMLDIGFGACGLMPGAYLRLQRIIGSKPMLDFGTIPNELQQISRTLR